MNKRPVINKAAALSVLVVVIAGLTAVIWPLAQRYGGNAETIAYRQRNVPDAIESATLELLAQYRSILSGNSPTPVLPEPAPTPTPKTTRPAGISISAALTANWPLLAAGATILLAIGAFIALHLHRRRFVLPIPEYRYRLCAPFSGGNSARTDYRQKHRQPPG
jgi:hypothetical protein